MEREGQEGSKEDQSLQAQGLCLQPTLKAQAAISALVLECLCQARQTPKPQPLRAGLSAPQFPHSAPRSMKYGLFRPGDPLGSNLTIQESMVFTRLQCSPKSPPLCFHASVDSSPSEDPCSKLGQVLRPLHSYHPVPRPDYLGRKKCLDTELDLGLGTRTHGTQKPHD